MTCKKPAQCPYGWRQRQGAPAVVRERAQAPSGRWQARYVGPDGVSHRAPTTFQTKGDAQTWLSTRRADITREAWLPEATKGALTVAQPGRWLALPRAQPLKPRTVAHYRALLDRFILPGLGGVKVRALTPEMVEDWHATFDAGTPTYRAHAYALLRTLMGWAVEKRHATVNPCQIRGAEASSDAATSDRRRSMSWPPSSRRCRRSTGP